MAPSFRVREGYAVYRGPSPHSSLHRHAAFQVVLAAEGEATVVDASGISHRGAAVLVRPMVWHRLEPIAAVLAFYVDPHCAFADGLRASYCDGVTVDPGLRDLDEQDILPGGALPSTELDARLRRAMDALADQDVPLPAVAAQVCLSPQRLRTLAKQQLGLPLARWRTWQRLARAAEALQQGLTLADAALVGGFADQAHFSRQMREMIGMTPSAVLPLLRRSVATGDVDRDRAGDR